MVPIPVSICLVATALLVYAEAKDNAGLRAGTKIVAALSFVVASLVAGSLDAAGGRLVLAGLVCSVVGDIALLSAEDRFFKLGIAAFGLAHLAYVAAFLRIGVHPAGTAIALLVVAGLSYRVWIWLKDHVGQDMRGPVLAYIVLISLMVACALGSYVMDIPAMKRVFMLWGAIFFFVSDITVARDRFVVAEFRNRVVGLPLYFLAQLMLGVSVAWV